MKNLLKIIFTVVLFSSYLFSFHCESCKKSEGVVLKQCTGCESVSYCDSTCQKTDWKNHKKSCKKLKEARINKRQTLEQEVELSWAIAQMHENSEKIKGLTGKFNNLLTLGPKAALFAQFESNFSLAEKYFAEGNLTSAEFFANLAFNCIKYDNSQRELIGKSTYLLALIKLSIINSSSSLVNHQKFRDELSEYLAISAEYGNENSQALLALLGAPEDEGDSSFLDNDTMRIELERYAYNEAHGRKIRTRLAFQYYVNTNTKKAHKIFDELLLADNVEEQTMGAVGKLTLAVNAQTDQIKPLLNEARKKYLSLLNQIPVPVKHDLAFYLDKYGDQNDVALVSQMLAELIISRFPPAIYLAEERNIRLGINRAESMPVDLPDDNDSALEIKVATKALSAAEAKTSSSLKQVTKSTKNSAVHATIAAMDTKFMVLSPIAYKDLKKLIKSNNGKLPFAEDALSSLAEEVVTANGQCRPSLAKKIRGTDTFWRSWLGRNHRMDWQYEKQANGQIKIKIRHVGAKSVFTYRS